MKPTVITGAVILLGASVFGGARLAAASAGSSPAVKSNLASVPAHMIAAFNIDQPSTVPGATSDGLQTAFHYDYDPGTDIEQAYQQNNLMQINGRISQLMWDYECHRIHTVVTVPPGAWGFCSTDLYPSMNYSNLMASVQSYLQQAASDTNIHGYWVLDDWPYYDATSAQVLVAIHNLVQQYTPGRPTICGFGGFITQSSYEWQPSMANNFTPQGCDEIAWYIYPDTVSGSVPSASQYNWSMPGLMSKMTSDFEARGWNPSQTPLIGIPAAFGGQDKSDGSYQVVPTQQSVATQTQAFCQAGASSIAFYAWDLTDYNNPQDPSDNAGISAGVRQGINACQQIWGSNSTTPPAPTSTPVPTSPPAATSTPVVTAPPAPVKTPAPAPTSVPPSNAAAPVSLEAESSSDSGAVAGESYVSASQGRYIQFTAPGSLYSGCSTPSAPGVAQQWVNVPATGTYYTWSRITASSTGNSYWLQVDGRCPIDVGDLNGMGTGFWQWVNYSNGNPSAVIALQLTAGPHLIRMYDREPNVDLDRLILTPNAQCVPYATGDNCAASSTTTGATGVR